MQITTDGLTDHIYDTLPETDAEIKYNDEIGSYYLEVERHPIHVRVFYNTQPEDVFNTADIESVDFVDISTGRTIDIKPEVFHVADVYEFVNTMVVVMSL